MKCEESGNMTEARAEMTRFSLLPNTSVLSFERGEMSQCDREVSL